MSDKPKFGQGGSSVGNVVYFVQSARGIKIGTTSTINTRLAPLRKQYPDLQVLGFISGSYSKEGHIHALFWKDNFIGDWFHASDELQNWIAANTVKRLEDLPHNPELPKALTWEEIKKLKGKKVKPPTRLILISEALYRGLEELSIETGKSSSDLGREAIDIYLRSNGKDVKFKPMRGGDRRSKPD